ncbi:superinfection immunity protein (plasmid) [Brucella pituitosa]|uniref:superinfection immunity protein n=1 Tax=Brucella pituitosa TaxID=571256 RepID=UPI003C7122E8
MAVLFNVSNVAYASNSEDNGAFALLVIIILIAIAVIFFLPSIIAFNRGHPNRWIIFIINFVFGATLLGWLICLVWSMNAIHVPGSGSNGGESGLNIFANDEKLVRVTNAESFSTKPTMADHIKQLEQLKALLESGGLSNDEYEVMRRKILSSIV